MQKEDFLMLLAPLTAVAIEAAEPSYWNRASTLVIAFVLGTIMQLTITLTQSRLPIWRSIISKAILTGFSSVVAVIMVRLAQEKVSFLPTIPEIEWGVALTVGFFGSEWLFKRIGIFADAVVARGKKEIKGGKDE